jgi:cyclin H
LTTSQEQPDLDIAALQKSLPAASDHLSTSRETDAEFLYTPSQIALACWHLASPSLVESFLNWKYSSFIPPAALGAAGGSVEGTPALSDVVAESGEGQGDEKAGRIAEKVVYGMKKERLLQILGDIEGMIKGVGEVELKRVKEVDKRLKGCTNPEKVPGTAL